MIKQVLIFTAIIAAATISLLNAKHVEHEPIATVIVSTSPMPQLAESKIVDYTFEFTTTPDETATVVDAPVENVDYTFEFPSRQAQ